MVMIIWSTSSYQNFIWETVHQVWLWVSTKHRCYKHRVHLSSSSCNPALCQHQWCRHSLHKTQTTARSKMLDGQNPLKVSTAGSVWYRSKRQHKSQAPTQSYFPPQKVRDSVTPINVWSRNLYMIFYTSPLSSLVWQKREKETHHLLSVSSFLCPLQVSNLPKDTYDH